MSITKPVNEIISVHLGQVGIRIMTLLKSILNMNMRSLLNYPP